MKKALKFKFVHLAMPDLLLLNSAGVAISCDMACKMDSKARASCVLKSLSQHDAARAKGSSISAPACGSLHIISQAQSLASQAAQLLRPAFESRLSLALPSGFASQVHAQAWASVRAGPSLPRPKQAFFSLPSQQAPPVLS